MRVPFYKARLSAREFQRVKEVMESGWLTTASVCAEFEREFATMAGVKHAVAVNSCTSALFLVFRFLRQMMQHDQPRVIMPTWTFVATATAAQQAGFDIMFADCEPETLNMDLDKLESLLKQREFDVVLPVHFAGEPVDLDRVKLVCLEGRAEESTHIFEDCAHATGSYYKDKHVGTQTFAGCFSFYATKNITSGEGGMVTTNNSELAEWVRIARNHGLQSDAAERYTLGKWVKPMCEAEGYKMNLPDVLAAIGVEQLKSLTDFVKMRKTLADLYDDRILKMNIRLGEELVRPLKRSSRIAPHLYVLLLNAKINRDKLAAYLVERGVEVHMHYMPVHLHPWYLAYEADCPVAEELATRALSLPFWVDMPVERRALHYVSEMLERGLRAQLR